MTFGQGALVGAAVGGAIGQLGGGAIGRGITFSAGPGRIGEGEPPPDEGEITRGARSAPRSAAPSAPTSVGPLGHLGHDQEARAGDDRKRRQWTVRAVTALRLESVRGFTFLACARDGFGRPADFPGSWTRPSKRFIVD
jgi:hypothetical protein